MRAMEFSWARALLRADTLTLSRMIADEFIEISRLGSLRTKTDNIRDLGSGDLRLTSATRDSLAVRIYGDVAVVRGVANNAGSIRLTREGQAVREWGIRILNAIVYRATSATKVIATS